MCNMLWPFAIVFTENFVYNICTNQTPSDANAFFSLAVTYLVAAACSIGLYFAGAHDRVAVEVSRLNWTSLALGAVVVALEVGYIFLYRAGWKVNMGSLTANICLACALVIVGALLYHETVSLRQGIGMVICLIGLVLVCK
ncbi:MAG: EamA family transporter [Butyricicoccus sp.]|nr:EamA family transporter [Butyricicoccus sp.]